MVEEILLFFIFLVTVHATSSEYFHYDKEFMMFGISDYSKCNDSLSTLTLPPPEFYKKIYEIYELNRTAELKVKDIEYFVQERWDSRNVVGRNTLSDGYNIFCTFTISDYQRSHQSRIFDLLEVMKFSDMTDFDSSEYMNNLLTMIRLIDSAIRLLDNEFGQHAVEFFQKNFRVYNLAEEIFFSANLKSSLSEGFLNCMVGTALQHEQKRKLATEKMVAQSAKTI